jgi:hypothetical protein
MKTYRDELEQFPSDGMAMSLDHFPIVELWASAETLHGQNKVLEDEIGQAVVAGELKATVLLRDSASEGGHRELPMDRWHLIHNHLYAHS